MSIHTLIGNKKMPPCYLLCFNSAKEKSEWLKAINYNINTSDKQAVSFLEFDNSLQGFPARTSFEGSGEHSSQGSAKNGGRKYSRTLSSMDAKTFVQAQIPKKTSSGSSGDYGIRVVKLKQELDEREMDRHFRQLVSDSSNFVNLFGKNDQSSIQRFSWEMNFEEIKVEEKLGMLSFSFFTLQFFICNLICFLMKNINSLSLSLAH